MSLPLDGDTVIPSTPNTDCKFRQHLDGTWDAYVYDADNHRMLMFSNQHYENYEDCRSMAYRVLSANMSGTLHFTDHPIGG